VVNVDFLKKFLEQAAKWFYDLGLFLQEGSGANMREALVQKGFLQSLISTTEQLRQYDNLWWI
jgi:hypothetical protein